MIRQNIDIKKLNVKPGPLWNERGLLLCAGDYKTGEYNAMTVAWGSLGIMWHKPFVQIVVRPGRYTYEFIEKYPEWTLSRLPESHRSSMTLMGSKSGRDMDKIHDAGLTVCPSVKVGAPAFEEAELILECRTLYRDTMKPEFFKNEKMEMFYPEKDYHVIYFGEILAVQGIDKYSS